MRYVFQNIFTCLLLAAIIGGIVGWILRAMRSGSKLTELEGMWQGKLDHLEDSWRGRFGALQGERDKLVASLRDTEAVAGDWKAKFSGLEDNYGKLKLDFDGVSGKLPALETAIAAGTAAAVKLTADLKSCSEARTLLEAKAGDLEAKLNQAVADDKAGDAAYEKRMAELSGQINTLKTDLAGAAKAHADAEGAWKVRFTGLENDRNGIQTLLSNLTSKAADDEKTYQARMGELTAANQKAQADLEARLNQAVADGKADDAAYEKRIADLIAAHQKTQADLATAAQAGADLEARLNKVVAGDKANDAAYEKRIADLIAAHKKAETDLEIRLNKAIAGDKADDAAYEKRIADLTAANHKIQIDLSAALRTQSNLEGSLNKALADDKADDAAYEKRIAELTTANQKAQADGARNGEELVALRARIAELQAAPSDTPYEALKARFDSFLVRTQRDGYGDIERIEGIGPVYGQKLRSIGIAWVTELLEQGAGPEGRTRIAAETGVDRGMILTWVNAADLLRVEGMTPDFAELLEVSGVDTVKELRNRVPENLHKKAIEVNAEKRLSKVQPTLDQVADWIAKAKTLAPKVTH